MTHSILSGHLSFWPGMVQDRLQPSGPAVGQSPCKDEEGALGYFSSETYLLFQMCLLSLQSPSVSKHLLVAEMLASL